MSREAGRTAPCGPREARFRLNEAHEFLSLAELADSDNSSVSNSVLAGIAACDAACCMALGRMSRGQSHRQATSLVKGIHLGGEDASKRLARLLALKDASHYGADPVSGSNRRAAERHARALIEFAEQLLAA